jgi:hypothetical protein
MINSGPHNVRDNHERIIINSRTHNEFSDSSDDPPQRSPQNDHLITDGHSRTGIPCHLATESTTPMQDAPELVRTQRRDEEPIPQLSTENHHQTTSKVSSDLQITLAAVEYMTKATDHLVTKLETPKGDRDLPPPSTFEDKEELSIEEFFVAMDRYIEATATSKEGQRCLLDGYLCKEARDFLRSHPHDHIYTYDQYKILLLDRFSSTGHIPARRKEFADATMTSDHTATSYMDYLNRLRRQAYPTEDNENAGKEVVLKFTETLNPLGLRQQMQTLFAFLGIQHHDTAEVLRKTIRVSQTLPSAPQQVQQPISPPPTRTHTIKTLTERLPPPNKTCFSCGGTGHRMAGCTTMIAGRFTRETQRLAQEARGQPKKLSNPDDPNSFLPTPKNDSECLMKMLTVILHLDEATKEPDLHGPICWDCCQLGHENLQCRSTLRAYGRLLPQRLRTGFDTPSEPLPNSIASQKLIIYEAIEEMLSTFDNTPTPQRRCSYCGVWGHQPGPSCTAIISEIEKRRVQLPKSRLSKKRRIAQRKALASLRGDDLQCTQGVHTPHCPPECSAHHPETQPRPTANQTQGNNTTEHTKRQRTDSCGKLTPRLQQGFRCMQGVHTPYCRAGCPEKKPNRPRTSARAKHKEQHLTDPNHHARNDKDNRKSPLTYDLPDYQPQTALPEDGDRHPHHPLMTTLPSPHIHTSTTHGATIEDESHSEYYQTPEVTMHNGHSQENYLLPDNANLMQLQRTENNTQPDMIPRQKHWNIETQETPEQEPFPTIWISLGETQIAYTPNIQSDITVTGESTWRKYRETLTDHANSNQSKHTELPPTMKRIRFSEQEMTANNPQTIAVHGPYEATFHVDGIALTLRTFVTADGNLSRPFILQRECWHQHEFAYVEHQSHPITRRSQTVPLFDDVPYVALVDMSAEPSVMAQQIYIALGGDIDELTPTTTRLLAASGDLVSSPGETRLIPFRLGSYHYHWSFIIVGTLGSENITLGRDFLNWHKASIHLHRNELSFQRPGTGTQSDVKNLPTAPFYSLSAKCVEEVLIRPGMTREVDMLLDMTELQEAPVMNLSPTNRQTIYVRGDNNAFSSGLSTSGLSTSHTLANIHHNIFRMAISNSGDQHFQTSLRDKTVLTVHRITRCHQNQQDIPPTTQTATSISLDYPQYDIHAIHRIKQDHHSNDSSSGCSGTLEEEDDFPITPDTQQRENQHETDDSTPRDMSSDERSAHLIFPHFTIASQNLDDEQLQSLQHILHNNADTFSKSPADLGRTNLVTHDIELRQGAKPFRTTLQRTTSSNKTFTARTIQDLLHMGLIRESKSPFASPSDALHDKLGRLHFGVDFRRLNELTIRTPDVDEDHSHELTNLTSANYFSTIKLGPAFWQIPIRNSDKPKTAFVTNTGLFEWEVIPFGICNASATFQRLMTQVLPTHDNQPGDLTWCTGDIIIIATTTIHQHLQRLLTTLSNLKKAQLKIKPSHCRFFRTRIKLMGRIIENNQLSLDPSRQQTITGWKPPLDKIQLQSFLNLVQYYREFIPNHATLITPLKLLQRKKVTYDWHEQAQQTFDMLKRTLVEEPILMSPQPKGRFVLDTDASAVAIAGILQQWQDTSYGERLCVISYGSRALRDEERNYGAPKAEMLAVLTFYERYKSILGDNEFDLRCDAQALRYINTWQVTDHTMYGWLIRLSMANFRYEHRLRDKHQNADSLTKQTQHYQKGEPRPKIAHGFPFISQEDYDRIKPLPPEATNHEATEETEHQHTIQSIWNKHTYPTRNATGPQNKRTRETHIDPGGTSASPQKKRPRAHSLYEQTHDNNNPTTNDYKDTEIPQMTAHHNHTNSPKRAFHANDQGTPNQQIPKRQRTHMTTPTEPEPEPQHQTPWPWEWSWHNTHKNSHRNTHTYREKITTMQSLAPTTTTHNETTRAGTTSRCCAKRIQGVGIREPHNSGRRNGNSNRGTYKSRKNLLQN